MQRRLFLSPNSNCSRIILMGSRIFLLLKSSAPPAVHARVISHHSCSSCLQTNNFHSGSWKNNLSLFPSSKHFPAIYQRATGYATMPIPRPIAGVDLATLDNQSLVDEKLLMILRQKLQTKGIHGESYLPGQYNALLCPSCKGGDLGEKSLSLKISPNGGKAEWTCFRAECGWRGATRAFVNVASTYESMNKTGKVMQPINTITEESLGLEPLCNQLLAYFAERMINKETLLRNNVMQVVGDRNVIAFPYRQNGQLVGYKYRTLDKKFWQARDTQKVFYGIDDIVEADEIIIVEGEVDKLSVEEAGYYNCISVPSGAPKKLSLEELPSIEKDTKFQYLWKCKDYFDKASRIILATDGDIPGQALAEELARRLGKERCRRVHWPKKDAVRYFKDANEVLVNLGAEALRDAIDKAELFDQRLGALGAGVDLATLDNQSLVDEKQLMILRQKLLETIGIHGESYLPGQYNTLLCPFCKGGDSGEKSLSLNILPNGVQAEWTCFRAKCGWRGATSAFANVTTTNENLKKPEKVKQPIGTITEESLGLEPLGNELLAYFAERMINKETLLRNKVMQVVGDRNIIAFPYRQNGQLVSCKYRTLDRKYWQARNTEKVFYGLDDIVEADEIIIVEGEMDKLSVEEAGYKNCISVPNGAPMPPKKLSKLKELPSLEKDTQFQYLWKAKDYFDKASRIILATDGDKPGQALAEELARRLGKERCRRVQWPKKDEVNYFKDANEVLVNLGAEALREAIDKAELFQMQKLD